MLKEKYIKSLRQVETNFPFCFAAKIAFLMFFSFLSFFGKIDGNGATFFPPRGSFNKSFPRKTSNDSLRVQSDFRYKRSESFDLKKRNLFLE
jgi:hypothetical protein